MGKDAVDHLFDVIERDEAEAADTSPEAADERPVDIVLRVHVEPGAGRSAVSGHYGDALKVKVAAPPEGARANQAVAELLASTLGVPASAVAVESGAASRSKRIRIGPVELATVRRLLTAAEVTPQGAGAGRGNARGSGGVR
ncbi:MAG TPA: DUF167 domain-containing protein [Acidimicrobiales bacterium]|nr:DUF167 domain-containing protein [Acidimicrobiales bacterium]